MAEINAEKLAALRGKMSEDAPHPGTLKKLAVESGLVTAEQVEELSKRSELLALLRPALADYDLAAEAAASAAAAAEVGAAAPAGGAAEAGAAAPPPETVRRPEPPVTETSAPPPAVSPSPPAAAAVAHPQPPGAEVEAAPEQPPAIIEGEAVEVEPKPWVNPNLRTPQMSGRRAPGLKVPDGAQTPAASPGRAGGNRGPRGATGPRTPQNSAPQRSRAPSVPAAARTPDFQVASAVKRPEGATRPAGPLVKLPAAAASPAQPSSAAAAPAGAPKLTDAAAAVYSRIIDLQKLILSELPESDDRAAMLRELKDARGLTKFLSDPEKVAELLASDQAAAS